MARTKHIKQIVVKVILRGQRPTRKTFIAPRGKIFTRKGIEGIVAGISAELEKRGLGDALRLVQIGPAEFNFVPREEAPPEAAG